MSPDAQKILDEARQLPPSEREWVAHGLLIDESEEIDPQWAAEVERRVADANSCGPGFLNDVETHPAPP
jgi:hypothetical protein